MSVINIPIATLVQDLNKEDMKVCLYCGKKLKGNQRKWCSVKCASLGRSMSIKPYFPRASTRATKIAAITDMDCNAGDYLNKEHIILDDPGDRVSYGLIEDFDVFENKLYDEFIEREAV